MALSTKAKNKLEAASRAPELSKREKELRDSFVSEYLVDGSEGTGVKAAIRVGYGASFAAEMATKFLCEPYVQQQIQIRKTENVKVNLTPEELRSEALANLRNIANDPSASSNARVAAIGKMADMEAWNAPAKKEITGANGMPLNPVQVEVFFSDEVMKEEP